MTDKNVPTPASQESADGNICLRGVVEHIVYANEDNGYTVFDFGCDDDVFTVVGEFPMLSPGEEVVVYGRWITNAKYGQQFQAVRHERPLPAGAEAILQYLSHRAIKGIGQKTARRIVDEFGDETFDVMENHPDWLSHVQGISLKKAREISAEFREKSGMRNLMLAFGSVFGPTLLMRIYQKWGSRSTDVVRDNPYLLCREIEGIGFEKADELATSLGLQGDSPARVESGICYVLEANAMQNGHVCLPQDKAVATAAAMLDVPEGAVETGVASLIKSGEIRSSILGGQTFLYTKEAYYAERYIVKKMTEIDRACLTEDISNVYAFIDREEKKNGVVYADLQRRAICDALQNGVMVLTGGPGTGKTTVVRALLAIFNSMGYRVALAAPTGRAAQRLSESTGADAKTIHRLLEMEYSGEGHAGNRFARDDKNLLDENVIIIDEVSMVDNFLMAALLKAVKPGAHLILIGDADQLPSVGPGEVLNDVIRSGRFSTVCLHEIFRQAGQSLIVTNAHAINEGRMPQNGDKNSDFFLMERTTNAATASTIVDLCIRRLPTAYGPDVAGKIQVICPGRRGEGGSEHLNVLLQAALNPPTKLKKEHKMRDRVFREGDRVMQIRNNYDLSWSCAGGTDGMGIFNGDIGKILEIDEEAQELLLDFDGRQVVYPMDMLTDLDHAWAITVHKSQGSEYPIVILSAAQTAPMLQTRNLLYTAVTRGQKMVIVVGQIAVVEEMVRNNRQVMRYTGLCERLSTGDRV